LNGTICLLLPLDAQRTREEEDFSPLFLTVFSSPEGSKRCRHNPLACHVVEEWRGRTPWAVRGGSTVATPVSLSPLFFTYKYRGDEGKKRKKRQQEGARVGAEQREKKRETREHKKGENRERKKEQKGKKTKKKNRGGRGRGRRSFASHHSPSTATTTPPPLAAPPRRHPR